MCWWCRKDIMIMHSLVYAFNYINCSRQIDSEGRRHVCCCIMMIIGWPETHQNKQIDRFLSWVFLTALVFSTISVSSHQSFFLPVVEASAEIIDSISSVKAVAIKLRWIFLIGFSQNIPNLKAHAGSTLNKIYTSLCSTASLWQDWEWKFEVLAALAMYSHRMHGLWWRFSICHVANLHYKGTSKARIQDPLPLGGGVFTPLKKCDN